MSLSSCSIEFAQKVEDAVQATECDSSLLLGDLHEYEHVYLIGNGGSSAVASHIANDLVKVAKMRGQVLTDPALLTCMANDYGWEDALREIINRYILQDDCLICISSSGRSENIIRAANFAQSRGAFVVTLTGFDAGNPLRQIGDCNYWVPSDNYGVVEIAHLTILHALVNPG